MKLLLDMGLAPATGAFLRGHGHDVVHLSEEGLERWPDTHILEKAHEEERVLITHDLDFGDILAASGAALPSVVTLRLRNMRPERVNPRLREVLETHRSALFQGAVLTVSEALTRVRLLPVKDP